MADITISEVTPVVVNERQFTGPAGETIVPGQYVRLDPATGKVVKGNATTAAEARSGGIALTGGVAGQAVTVAAQGAVLDVGDALGDLDYDADVYLSNTDGVLADAAGTVTKIVGRVIPAWGHTTADKVLEIRMSEVIDVTFDLSVGNLPADYVRSELVAGQDETGDTTIPVAGLAAGDDLIGVFVQNGTSGVLTQRANADFTVGAGNLTVVANAANNAANFYLILWADRTP